jgi:putative ABC transport system substrate-binding protein
VSGIRRRDFVIRLGCGTVAAWPFAARAQQPGKVHRLGVLADVTPAFDGLFYGLHDFGYVEGENLIIYRRSSEGRAEQWSKLAAELVALSVDAIVVSTTPAALAAKKTTGTIPIIFPTALDLVGVGLAESLPKPGGNVTGFALLVPEVSAKGLTLLQEAVPGLRRVAVLWNGANPANALVWKEVEATARLAGLALETGQVREPKDFEATFAAIRQERPQGLLVLADAFFMQRRKRIVDFVLHEQLPAMFQFREFAQLGGLMSYGPNLQNMFRRAANYVDKIFKGAKPADLPIEQPTKFELVINLKTAKALGLTIPQTLLATADEVIE